MQPQRACQIASRPNNVVFMLLLIGLNWMTPAYSSSDSAIQFKNDLDAAMLSAYEGNRDAQFNVGVLFANNEFQPADHEQAAYWYKQAARQGHPLAQYNLGHQYMTGQGVLKSEKLAMDWWLKAARQSHLLAQFNVGRGYYLGIGLKEDHKKSRYWFEQAALQNEPKSTHILQKLGWTENLPESSVTETPQLPDSNEPITSKIEVISGDEETLIENNAKPAITSSNNENISATLPPTTDSLSDDDATPDPSAEQVSSSDDIDNAAQDTQTEDAISQNTPEPTTEKTVPVAVYTDPKINSVLITIVDNIASLNISQRGEEWATVTTNTGFPVWVHGDFLSVDGKQGTLTGSAVNARSVPIISAGTIVGRLDKEETVDVISEQKGWYRIVAPKRFVAWAKTNELTQHPEYEQKKPTEFDNPETITALSQYTKQVNGSSNDNEWLFTQPSDNFTLQLASFGTAEAVTEFVSRSAFIDNPDLHQFVSINDNTNDWTYFLYGSYTTREQATAGKEAIGQKNAWIRQFKQLRQNRCVTWKQQLPPPKELNKYCR